MTNQVRVGVGVIVKKDGKVLVGKRIGSHGTGSWSFPGGNLEYGESVEECAQREVLEESGLKVKNIRFETITNDIFKKENKHYITVFMSCDWKKGEPQVLEPKKMIKWQWRDWKDLPRPLFLTIKNLLKQEFSPF